MRPDMVKEETILLEVTDLKQWCHCPRVVFYRYCLPRIRPITGKMEEGILRHREEQEREERRLLRSYGITQGERHFDVVLRSPALGLSGRLDLLIITPGKETPSQLARFHTLREVAVEGATERKLDEDP